MTQMWLLLSLIALKHTQVTALNTHNSLRSITAAPNACANIMVDAPQSLQNGEMGRAMFSAGGRTGACFLAPVPWAMAARLYLPSLLGHLHPLKGVAWASAQKRTDRKGFFPFYF
jgi:hypothetical protein